MNCTSCHSSFNLNSGSGSLTITGVPPNYVPGEKYTITVTLRHTGQRRWGFEMTSRTSGGQQAGSFTIGTGTQIRSQGGIQYILHTLSGTQAGTQNQGTWTFTWTAPSPAVGTVRFSCAGNAANANLDFTGDYIYTKTATSEPGAATLPTTALFAHIAIGGGYTTAITLLNTGADAAVGNLLLTGQNGTPLDATISAISPGFSAPGTTDRVLASSFTVNVPAGGTQIITLSAPNLSSTVSGWARVESSGGQPNGVATFQYVEAGTLKTIAGVLSAETVESATIPLDDDLDADRYTGYAVANPGTGTVEIKVVTVGTDGNPVATLKPITLTAGKQQAGFFSLEDPAASRKFKGSVVLIAQPGQKFAVVALVQDRKLFTAIPVIKGKAPNISAPGPALP